jgi:uncharacterized Zn-binding protein involved in type VI secretion
MPGIVRVGDSHIGHASPTPNPFHRTTYVGGSPNVNVNSRALIRIGDSTGCGDPATSGSPNVFCNGIAVHRLGDATGGHGSWVPNASATSSINVFANGGGGSQVPYNESDSISGNGGCSFYDWQNNVCLDQSVDPSADYYVAP